MKNFKALATAVLIGGAALLTGCGEIDPNAVELEWEGDHIGYFQCDRNEYQPALGSDLAEVLDSNKWYNGMETLAAVLEMEGVGDNVFGTLGGAIFTGVLFERGEEICAENGLGSAKATNLTAATPEAVEQGGRSITEALATATPVAPPVAPVFNPAPAPANSAGEVVFTNDKGETTRYTYTSEYRGAATYLVTYSDGVQVMYQNYVNGNGEIRTQGSDGYWSNSDDSTWTRNGQTLTVVSEKGSTAVFFGFNFNTIAD